MQVDSQGAVLVAEVRNSGLEQAGCEMDGRGMEIVERETL